MKPGWNIKLFEDCIEKVTYTQKIQRKDFLTDGDYPVVSQEENFINGYWDNEADVFRVTTPIVVFGDHTKVLKYIDFDFVLGADGVKILQACEFLLAKFFYYQLQTVNLDSLGYARHYKLLKELVIAHPPLAEQQRIVSILDEAFESIATVKANTEKNLQNARSIFESHLQAVFTQRSEGWVEKRLGDTSLIEIIDGDRGVNYPKVDDFHERGHCLFLNTKNVRPHGFNFESTMFITAKKDGQLRKGKLKRDDVVLTTRGTIGNVGLYTADVRFDNIRINSGMLILRPNKLSLLPSFLLELLRSEIVKEQIRKFTTGAAQPQLPIRTLVNFTIPVPKDLEDQCAIVAEIGAFELETQRLESLYNRKLAALDELKKSLLYQAFSGQL